MDRVLGVGLWSVFATINGASIVVKAKNVRKPVAVRFAWSNTAEPHLFNAEGLPASSCRTDDWTIKLKRGKSLL